MKPSLITIILLIAAVHLPAFAGDFDSAPFGFYKEAEVKMESEGIAAFSLDSQIYEQLRHDYSNLRLVRTGENGTLEEVPFLREKFFHPRIDTHSKRIDTKEISLKETENNTIEIIIKLERRSPNRNAARLSIDTPLKDFERRVVVSGSQDGESWETLVAKGRIFDFTRYLDIRRTEIPLPKNNFRYFKVVIDRAIDDKDSLTRQISRQIRNGEETEREITANVTTRPFRIDRLKWFTLEGKKRAAPKDRIPYPLSGMDVSEDPEKKETVILLNSRNQPLTHFTLVTNSKNFRRQFSVQIPIISNVTGKADKWRTLQTSHLFRYQLGNFEEERLTIQFPEQRTEQYRIVIKNHDNPPLKIGKFEAEGPEYRLLSLADPGDRIRVYFGGDESKTLKLPVYDTSAITTGRSHGLKVAAFPLSSSQSNPINQPQKEGGRSFLNNKIFLWIAIALVVALLAWMLFGMAKKIENLPEE